MGKRRPITAETVAGVAAQNAGHPIDGDRAAGYAGALEPVMQMIDGLRALPLKDVEPALIFRPEQGAQDD
jgi:hypothetical protein